MLRVTTRDQLGRIVLRFLRCAMLPLRRGDSQTGHSDDISAVDIGVAEPALTATISGWKHGELDAGVRGLTIREGETREIKDFEVVHGSPGLARLTLNLATAHVRVDSAAPRLVYGGQAIAIAAGQLARLFPQCIYILAWMSCDHTAPVREGDGLRSRVTVERVRRLPCGWVVVELHCLVCAGGDRPDEPVLDWRPVALFA